MSSICFRSLTREGTESYLASNSNKQQESFDLSQKFDEFAALLIFKRVPEYIFIHNAENIFMV
jgi:hypothetical protein